MLTSKQRAYLRSLAHGLNAIFQVGKGGISDELSSMLYKLLPGCRVDCFNLGSQFVPHGSVSQLYKKYRLDGQSIADFILGVQTVES